MTRAIDKIIIHCSATKPTMDIGVKEITQWHKARGWADIGYHFVIRRNGEVEPGRDIEKVGAHTVGQNASSIGICLVGGIDARGEPQNNFMPHQMEALERLVRALKVEHRNATVHGHREFAAKACPSFDVQAWIKERAI